MVEKDALRTLPLADVWTDTLEETGKTTGTTAETGVSREIAELLPTDPDTAMPSQIQQQLKKHCKEQVAHQEQERHEKAR